VTTPGFKTQGTSLRIPAKAGRRGFASMISAVPRSGAGETLMQVFMRQQGTPDENVHGPPQPEDDGLYGFDRAFALLRPGAPSGAFRRGLPTFIPGRHTLALATGPITRTEQQRPITGLAVRRHCPEHRRSRSDGSLPRPYPGPG